VLLYLEFGSDKVGDQPGAAINDRELAGVVGDQGELVMTGKFFVHELLHYRLGRELGSRLGSRRQVGKPRLGNSLPLVPPPNPYPRTKS